MMQWEVACCQDLYLFGLEIALCLTNCRRRGRSHQKGLFLLCYLLIFIMFWIDGSLSCTYSLWHQSSTFIDKILTGARKILKKAMNIPIQWDKLIVDIYKHLSARNHLFNLLFIALYNSSISISLKKTWLSFCRLNLEDLLANIITCFKACKKACFIGIEENGRSIFLLETHDHSCRMLLSWYKSIKVSSFSFLYEHIDKNTSLVDIDDWVI